MEKRQICARTFSLRLGTETGSCVRGSALSSRASFGNSACFVAAASPLPACTYIAWLLVFLVFVQTTCHSSFFPLREKNHFVCLHVPVHYHGQQHVQHFLVDEILGEVEQDISIVSLERGAVKTHTENYLQVTLSSCRSDQKRIRH